MARVMEFRNFIGMFFGLVKSSQAIHEHLSTEGIKALLTERNALVAHEYKHADFEQIIGEIVLSRAIESFDLYLLSVLRQIFMSRPEMLKSEGKVDVADVIDLKNFEAIVAKIAERKLHDLSYKPLAELQAYIQRTTGIALFENKEIFDTVTLASEVRNLIAHNDCCISDIFRNRVKDVQVDYQIPERGRFLISDEWLRKTSYALDGVVFRFDEAVCGKFEIYTRDRKKWSLKRLDTGLTVPQGDPAPGQTFSKPLLR
jgi:hypothetical protein